MNSKGHLYLSLAKSLIRIGSAVAAGFMDNLVILVIGFVVAEIGGILEEVFDRR